jgi:hypothetical protein
VLPEEPEDPDDPDDPEEPDDPDDPEEPDDPDDPDVPLVPELEDDELVVSGPPAHATTVAAVAAAVAAALAKMTAARVTRSLFVMRSAGGFAKRGRLAPQNGHSASLART